MSVSTREFVLARRSDAMSKEKRAAVLEAPGFGRHVTDHMASARWNPSDGWHEFKIGAVEPLTLDPTAAVLHYGQSVFEGFKAYRHPDGSIWSFRPEVNAARFARSAARLALPELPVEQFIAACDQLVSVDRDWVPDSDGASLYLRPIMFGTEAFLGVRPAQEVLFLVLASPAQSIFPNGVQPLSIWLSNYVRAAPGGTGAAKCAGNYAAALIAHQEAYARGHDQVMFLDAVERRWIEELGGMNVFVVLDDGSLVTPPVSGTILDGVTRRSVITLATDEGYRVTQRPLAIDEWWDGVESGRIVEAFACGTAAMVTPIAELVRADGAARLAPAGHMGPVTATLRTALLDIQFGRAADRFDWMHHIV